MRVIVAGPTCSGKSALALALAERLGGTVVNADSMQVYRELRVVTARPSMADEARVPHALYGVRTAAEPGSVAWWRGAALEAMAGMRVPILCGGTGMYLASLVQGLADIPEVGEAARAEARGLLAALGAEGLHARLAAVDPATAAGVSDGQRVARAWEVWRGTGRGLASWLGEAALPAGGGPTPDPSLGGRGDYRMLLLDPPRDVLRGAIAGRFRGMLSGGAVEEVAALAQLGLDPALPAMRAHGVPELLAYLRGKIDMGEAERRTVLATGQYTKRQATWFRNRSPVAAEHTQVIHARFAGPEQFSESDWGRIESFVSGHG